MNLKDVGFLSVSSFARLSAEGVRQLQPITVVLNGDKPLCAVIKYEQYLRLQDEIASWKERAKQHGCNVENGDPDCG